MLITSLSVGRGHCADHQSVGGGGALCGSPVCRWEGSTVRITSLSVGGGTVLITSLSVEGEHCADHQSVGGRGALC